MAVALVAVTAVAAGSVSVVRAWTPATMRGADTPLFMTVENHGEGDALLRTRCTAANFVEQRTTDHGEGFPSMRTVKSIPIAANAVTQLGPDGYHVMLLQTTRALVDGETFNCKLSFRDSGTQDVEVSVGQPE